MGIDDWLAGYVLKDEKGFPHIFLVKEGDEEKKKLLENTPAAERTSLDKVLFPRLIMGDHYDVMAGKLTMLDMLIEYDPRKGRGYVMKKSIADTGLKIDDTMYFRQYHPK